MGNVTGVISALKEAGIRAEAAYPGRRMPHISESVAAVMLERRDHGQNTETIKVTVCTPSVLGGSACERTAETAAAALAELTVTGMCTEVIQQVCVFDSSSDCYMAQILVNFSAAMAASTQLSVTQGSTKLNGAVAFAAWKTADAENGRTVADAPWQILLEEAFPAGFAEQTGSDSGFQLTVTRGRSTEVFTNCAWISVTREDDPSCLRQTRTGTAESRSFTAK